MSVQIAHFISNGVVGIECPKKKKSSQRYLKDSSLQIGMISSPGYDSGRIISISVTYAIFVLHLHQMILFRKRLLNFIPEEESYLTMYRY